MRADDPSSNDQDRGSFGCPMRQTLWRIPSGRILRIDGRSTREATRQDAIASVRSAPTLRIPWCRAIIRDPNPAMVVRVEIVMARPALLPAISSSEDPDPRK